MGVARMLAASCRQLQAGSLCSPESISGVNKRSVAAQKFRGAHPFFAFELYFSQRQRAFASRNNQLFFADQNVSWLAAKIDKRRREYFQVSLVDFHKRTRPRIERANFSLDYFRRFRPIDPAIVTL